MESNKIDQLFRKKLEDLHSTPDIQAWNELENMLDRKRKKVIFWYYKIAASIVLFITVGYGLFHFTNSDEQEVPITRQEIYTPDQQSSESGDLAENPEYIYKKNVDIDQIESPENSRVVLAEERDMKLEDKSVEEPQYKAVIGEVEEIEQLALQEGLTIYELDEILLVDNDDVELPKLEVTEENLEKDSQSNQKPMIRITYKSAPKKENRRRVVIVAKLDTMKRWKPDFKNILKVPGNFLADVRDVKDLLFNPKDLTETENIP